jgi:hypothetical protein
MLLCDVSKGRIVEHVVAYWIAPCVIAPSAIVTVMYVCVGGVEMACVGGGSAKFRKRVDASRHVTL